MRIYLTVLFVSLLSVLGYAGKNKTQEKDTYVLIKTSYGNIKLKLYNETPLHKANFIKLVESKYYDSLLFHRVIKNFMIQAGDPDSKNAQKNQQLGMGGPDYTIPAEINPKFIHKKGALAAARLSDEINPSKASSGSQFYIIIGSPVNDETLNQNEHQITEIKKTELIDKYLQKPENASIIPTLNEYKEKGNKDGFESLVAKIYSDLDSSFKKIDTVFYTTQQREEYLLHGGSPHLDNEYTIFGEVVEGFDVIDKIAIVETNDDDRPKEDIRMTITIINK